MIKGDLDKYIKGMQTANKQLNKAIANAAINAFTENFRRGGFFSEKTWTLRKNDKTPGRGVLIGKGGGVKLWRSLYWRAEGTRVLIMTDVRYAKAHNEGVNETVKVKSHKVKSHLRKSAGGKRRKRVKAHTRASHSRAMYLPERRFMGRHKMLKEIIVVEIKSLLNDI